MLHGYSRLTDAAPAVDRSTGDASSMRAALWSMIPKSGCRFSDKIMLKSKRQSGMTIRGKFILL
jgi:hypothetical protein